MGNTYLSVDLDYFNGRDRSLLAFVQHIVNRPIARAKDHHDLLGHINKSGCNHLVNVDFHSDVTGSDPIELNDGTWVNYVTWKAGGRYTWRCPVEPGLANYCHLLVNPFTAGGSGWKKVEIRRGLGINWPSIKYVGVCVSPAWVQNRQALRDAMQLLRMPLEWLN